MNPEAEAVLKKILEKDPSELTEYDKTFLKARWSYVGKKSRAKFADKLKQKEEKKKEVVVEEDEAEEQLQHPGEQTETEDDEEEIDE